MFGRTRGRFLEFVEKFFDNENLDDILNIGVNKNGKILRNPVSPLITDLGSIPFRDFTSSDKLFINKKKVSAGTPCLNDRIYLINISKGCLFSCSFCIIPLLNELYREYGGYKYRNRSVENVIKELIEAKKKFPKLRRIRLDDELFVVDKKWIRDFSKEYKKYIGLPFDILIHPNVIREENPRLLKEAGLDLVLIRIQNTERINKILYNRNQTDRSVIKVADMCKNLKLRPCFQLILDAPISTSEDKRALFELIASLPRPYELYLFSLTFCPNTSLSKKSVSEGYIRYDDQLRLIKEIFYQYRVDLNFKRNKEDVFWGSLLVMVSKTFILIGILKYISGSAYFKKASFHSQMDGTDS
jgi:radical SAM superfamily enzyme YgiQ (UPF0313 family)